MGSAGFDVPAAASGQSPAVLLLAAEPHWAEYESRSAVPQGYSTTVDFPSSLLPSFPSAEQPPLEEPPLEEPLPPISGLHPASRYFSGGEVCRFVSRQSKWASTVQEVQEEEETLRLIAHMGPIAKGPPRNWKGQRKRDPAADNGILAGDVLSWYRGSVMFMGWEARKQKSDLEWEIAESKAMAVLARRQGLPCWEAVQMQMDRREAARILGRETRVQLRELLVSYATPESDTTGEESGGSDGEEGGCAHSSAFITRSRSKQPVPSELVSDNHTSNDHAVHRSAML